MPMRHAVLSCGSFIPFSTAPPHHWSRTVDTVSSLNKKVYEGKALDVIHVSEGLHMKNVRVRMRLCGCVTTHLAESHSCMNPPALHTPIPPRPIHAMPTQLLCHAMPCHALTASWCALLTTSRRSTTSAASSASRGRRPRARQPSPAASPSSSSATASSPSTYVPRCVEFGSHIRAIDLVLYPTWHTSIQF